MCRVARPFVSVRALNGVRTRGLCFPANATSMYKTAETVSYLGLTSLPLPRVVSTPYYVLRLRAKVSLAPLMLT